jgi:hypothetical protein
MESDVRDVGEVMLRVLLFVALRARVIESEAESWRV